MLETCSIVFQVWLNFDPVKEILKIYFNKESDFSEENTTDNKYFRSTFFNHFSLSLTRKKSCGNESHEKETNHIHASVVDLLHIRIGNLNWCKWEHCKNKAKEIDCLCCREVDVMLDASAKTSQHEGSISPSSFRGQLPNCYSHVLN